MNEVSHGQITKLLRETIIMLCKNGVYYEQQLRIQGLIGITIDDGTVFLVHMNECVNGNGNSSADKPVDNQSSVEASISSNPLCVGDVNEQHYAEVCHRSKTSEASASQHSCIKQERETSRTEGNLCGKSQNTANVPAPVNTSFSFVPETKFEDQVYNDDVICVDLTSGQTSMGSSCESSEVWNTYPYSVPSAAVAVEKSESDLLDHPARKSEAQGCRVRVQDVTSLYSESLDNKTGFGQMGVTHYVTPKSRKLLQSTPSQSARRGSGQRKMVPHTVPRRSWQVPQISEAQVEFVTSHQPVTLQHVPENKQFPPRRRGRPRKITQMTRSAEFGSNTDDDENKWGMVKVTKFACKLCGQTFTHQPNLLRHQITAHGRQKKVRGGRSAAGLS